MILHRLHPIIGRYLAPAGDGGSDAGGTGTGTEDRGDNWTPSEDDDVTDVEVKTKPDAKTAAEKDEDEDDEDDEDDKGDEKKDDPKAEKKDDPKAEKKDTRIPLKRHEKMLEKEREARQLLERQLAQYQKGGEVANVNAEITKAEAKVLALDEEYIKLIADGKTKEAADKMREIRTLERNINASKTELASAAASARAVEKARYDIVVERLETAYPQLNPDHDDFDEEASGDVLDLATTYRAKGMAPADAIQRAAKKLLKVEGKEQERATEVKPRVDAAEAEAAAKKAERERKQAQVKKNVETQGKQPPSTKNIGADHDKAGGSLDAKTVMRMSQDDFAKLSEADLARMRGDELA